MSVCGTSVGSPSVIAIAGTWIIMGMPAVSLCEADSILPSTISSEPLRPGSVVRTTMGVATAVTNERILVSRLTSPGISWNINGHISWKDCPDSSRFVCCFESWNRKVDCSLTNLSLG